MNLEPWVTEIAMSLEQQTEKPKYQALSEIVAEAIRSNQLSRDTKLPTVRELAKKLGLSGTTVAAAYRVLAQQQLITGKVGSGTRVLGDSHLGTAPQNEPTETTTRASPHRSLWRRRTQTNHIAALTKAFPHALNCAAGLPNPSLLPLEPLRRGWVKAVARMDASDLQYAGPAPVAALSEQLLKKLNKDRVDASDEDFVMGSSAQQLMSLVIQLASGRAGRERLLVGVEEPGYPTLFDAYERLGHRLIGIEVDDEGAVPASVARAIAKGVQLIVFTPRAHNPTGVSWSPSRLADLMDLLAEHPGVIVIEDDQFAEAANAQVGSLLNDVRIEDRIVYIRSFSKVIAPDLRLALAVVRQPLRSLLVEAKFYTDGWSSRLAQNSLAYAFADDEMPEAIEFAREAYNRRREGFTHALAQLASPNSLRPVPAQDGVNVWIELRNGTSAAEVAERAAAAGILVAAGEPFFVNIGHDDTLRVNVGMIAETDLTRMAERLHEAFLQSAMATPTHFAYHSL